MEPKVQVVDEDFIQLTYVCFIYQCTEHQPHSLLKAFFSLVKRQDCAIHDVVSHLLQHIKFSVALLRLRVIWDQQAAVRETLANRHLFDDQHWQLKLHLGVEIQMELE